MRLVAILLCASALCPGAVRRIYVEERSDVLQGRSFGTAGPYERIKATVHFAVDPAVPQNRTITDLQLAPRSAAGQVEFAADLDVIRPRDPKQGNGTILFDVVNRGGRTILTTFNRAAASNDPRSEVDFGDHFLLDKGFTLVWLGWQFDTPDTPNLMRATVPVAKGITGQVRSEFVPDAETTTMPLAERNHRPYVPVDLKEAGAKLTVRETPTGLPRPLERSEWSFADSTSITMAAGFKPGRIYELVYTAKDPAIVGLGLAAVRDIISFLKYEDSPFVLGDQHRDTKRAIGFGVSQSGRFLRTLLYDGFNADEKGRKVFDAVWPHVAGAGRGSFNRRFGQPSRDGQPWANYLWPTDIFPFTDLPLTDNESRTSGGLLVRATEQKAVPKIFYTNGSYEYWGRAASLIHTTPDGKDDARLASDTRVYFIAGAQHGPGRFPPQKTSAQNLSNTNDYRWTMRALLLALDSWMRDDKQPPASVYPSVERGQLVSRSGLKFPTIPNITVPAEPRIAYRLNFETEPPRVGLPYAVMLPQVDVDGNEASGVRVPCVQVPLGTYTGWNLRHATIGASQGMIAFTGTFAPFPATEEERQKSKDPRLSIEKRYATKKNYLSKINAASEALAREGFLLTADIPAVAERASAEWDYWTKHP